MAQFHLSLRSFIILLVVVSISCSEKNQGSEDYPSSSTLVSIKSEDAQLGEPYLYTDPQDKTFLSWIEKKDSLSQLKYSVWEGNGWSEPKLIAEGTNWFVNWADYPQLSSFQNGTLAAFFLEKSGAGPYAYDIKITLSSDGDIWQEPFILHHDGTETEHGFVSMVPWEDQMFVAWLDGRNTAAHGTTGGGHDHGHGGAMTLRGAKFDVRGLKTKEWELDDRVCDCCQTTAVMALGGPLVVFRDRNEEEFRDLGMVRFAADGWTGTMPVYNDFWKVPGCPVNGPRADARGDRLAVAWYSGARDIPEVKVSFSIDGGGTFENPIRIDQGKTIGRVDLVMLTDSSAMVSWMEGAEILARKVFRSGKLGPVILIASSSEKRSSGFPQLTTNGDELFFAWADDSGGEFRINTSIMKLD